MKTKLLILLAFLFVSNLGMAQSGLTMPAPVRTITSPALVETQLVKTAGIKDISSLYSLTSTQKIVNRKYMDGLGRDLQFIYFGAGSSSRNDLVFFNEYDATGKISKNFLPYASNTQKQFQENASSDQLAFYATTNTIGKYAKDNAPFATTVYDNSPVQRILNESGYGTNWQLSTGKVKQYASRANTLSDNVRLFKADGSSTSFYEAGTLNVSELLDEEGYKSIIFTNNQGNTILKRQLLEETIGGQYHQFKETYYVYDMSDAICIVLPPKVVAELRGNGWSLNATHENHNIFKFIYDDEGRLIKRKVPSSDWVYIIYDKLDRPVLLQDGRQRAANKWYFTKYDQQNRRIMEGMFQDNTHISYEDMKTLVDAFDYTNPEIPFGEGRGNQIEGYSNLTFPVNITVGNLLSTYYYDTYDIDNNLTSDFSYIIQGLGPDEPIPANGQGYLTVVKNRIIGTSDWLQKILFYDREGRAIQQQSNNIISLSASDATTVVYNFDGTIKKKISKKNTGGEQKITEQLTYDAANRLKEITHQVNNLSPVTIATYEYNELGQLTDKNLGKISSNNYLQSIDYRYNIRGWLTNINNPTLTADGYNEEGNDVFGMELLYENQDDIGNTQLYNGQVSGVKWKSKMINHNFTNLERAYTYNYDKLGQLRGALFKAKQGGAWNHMIDAFSEKEIKYDLNGNLIALRRFMWNTAQNNVLEIDQLSYNYNSVNQDQLLKVDDGQGYSGGFGFNDQVNESVEYEYDVNGNLIKDKNKGFTYDYNDLNKVSRISSIGDPSKYISFEYSSTGVRVKKSIYQSGNIVRELKYLDEFIYEGGQISSVSNAEGRVRFVQGAAKYEYFIKDHLGNVRVSFEEESGQAVVRQESSYYAFGMQHSPISKPADPNSALFNSGSEWLADFDNDPDLYSTFFRNYDPVLGRFNGVDPMATEYADFSVYNFAFNNPVNFSDPTGLSPDIDTFYHEAMQSEFGGSWSATEGTKLFQSDAEAFGAGTKYNDIFQSWDFTDKGHRDRSIESFLKNYGEDSKISGIRLNEVKIKKKTGKIRPNDAKIKTSNGAGVRVIPTELIGKGGGMTIPEIGIFVNPRSLKDENLLKHEFGHVLQYRKLGPHLYYWTKALPSLISATWSTITKSNSHHNSGTETDANDLAYEYFNGPITWGKPINWDVGNFPLKNAYPAPLIAPNDVYNTLF